jgi:hypothetical protein
VGYAPAYGASRRAVITEAFGVQAEYLQAVRDQYSASQLARYIVETVERINSETAALGLAEYAFIDASWVWGIISHEASLVPVGLIGTPATLAEAVATDGTDFGMGQLTWARFNSEVGWYDRYATGPPLDYGYTDLIDPFKSADMVIASLQRFCRWDSALSARDKPAIGVVVGYWWAQNESGAQEIGDRIYSVGRGGYNL